MKKHHFFILTSILLIVLALLLPWFSGTPFDKYVPKNIDEKNIVSLIQQFHKAKSEYDLATYLSCLDEHGRYMFSGHLMVTKKELANLLPDFWSALKSKNRQVNPMSRENLNGNFLNGALYDPIITISNDSARVSVTFQTPLIHWRTLLLIDLVRKDGVWLISRFEWDMG